MLKKIYWTAFFALCVAVTALSAYAYYRDSKVIEKIKKPKAQIAIPPYKSITFDEYFRNALNKDFKNANGGLCLIPLTTPAPLPCAGIKKNVSADIIGFYYQISENRLYTYDPKKLYDKPVSIASLSKILIAVPVLLSGAKSSDKYCPKKAKMDNNGHYFKRVTAPKEGFSVCNDAQLITIRTAFAQSDNLVFYEITQKYHDTIMNFLYDFELPLGDEKDSNTQFGARLSFGNYIVKPSQFFKFYVDVFTACKQKQNTKNKTALKIMNYAKDEQAFTEMCSILDAPLTESSGTLNWTHKSGFGKTGTIEADKRTGRLGGKFMIYANPQTEKVSFLMINSTFGIAKEALQLSDFSNTVGILTK